MEKEIIESLQPLFRKVFSVPDLIINSEMSAKDVASWDSLTHMSMIHEVEVCFGIKFKLKELSSMRNVGDMIHLITQKKQA